MPFKFLAATLAAGAMLTCSPAFASTVVFIPSADMAGGVMTANNNDLYAMGRGVVFKATSTFTLTNVSLYQSLFGQNLTFSISKGGALTGNVAGGTTLWSTTQTVSTSGLGLIDFALPEAITLEAGETYFLNFSFGGASAANFYYNEGGSPSYSAPGLQRRQWRGGRLRRRLADPAHRARRRVRRWLRGRPHRRACRGPRAWGLGPGR